MRTTFSPCGFVLAGFLAVAALAGFSLASSKTPFSYYCKPFPNCEESMELGELFQCSSRVPMAPFKFGTCEFDANVYLDCVPYGHDCGMVIFLPTQEEVDSCYYLPICYDQPPP